MASLVSDLPQEPNIALVTHDGTIVARLSNEEFLILGSLSFDSQVVADIEAATISAMEKAAYPLPRADSHCLFALVGAAAADAMAKLCEVDLRGRKFPPGSIAQTSIARVNGVVISHNFGPRPGFFILCDTASTEYLWRSIIDAIDEYNGGAVGLQNITTAGPN
jgi:sarcosine oxidase subunit gamma